MPCSRGVLEAQMVQHLMKLLRRTAVARARPTTRDGNEPVNASTRGEVHKPHSDSRDKPTTYLMVDDVDQGADRSADEKTSINNKTKKIGKGEGKMKST